MFRTAILTAVLVGASVAAQAQEDYVILEAFESDHVNSISGEPSPLVKGHDGNFYGRNGFGVFRVTPDGVFSPLGHVLLRETALDGGDGYFYAVTKPLEGTAIVKFTESSAPAIIYQFTHASQGTPIEPLVLGTDGQIYGIIRFFDFPTDAGAKLFRLSPDGVLTFLHSFPYSEGVVSTRLIRSRNGDFFGVTSTRVFRATLDGSVTTVHAFTGGPGGASPQPFLLEASDGALYGTTLEGGSAGAGIIFRVRPDGAFTVLYSFPGHAVNGIDAVTAPFIEGTDGNFYGTSRATVFRLTPAGHVRVLHSVANAYPGWAGGNRYGIGYIGVLEGANGNLYGTAGNFGPGGAGVLFRLNRQRSPCLNTIEPIWQFWQEHMGGTLYLLGAVKTETPALYGAWFVASGAVTPLWTTVTPPIDPTFSFELAMERPNSGTVGVLTLVLTASLNVCADWKTVDTGTTSAVSTASTR